MAITALHFQKLMSVNTVPLCHPQINVKASSCKEEAVCEQDPEMVPSFLGQRSLEIN